MRPELDDALEWAVGRAEANNDLAGGVLSPGPSPWLPMPESCSERTGSMAKLTKAQREWRPGMPKKRRSIKTMFASTVLLLEAFVVLLRARWPSSGSTARRSAGPLILGLGIGLGVCWCSRCALLRRPAGYWPSAGACRCVLILTGIVEPAMFLVGVLFAVVLVVRGRARAADGPGERERDANRRNGSARPAGKPAADRGDGR